MLNLAIVIGVVFCLLVVGELLAKRNKKYPELNRKFVHIAVGSFVAFWPLILTWEQIIGLSIAFVCVVTISKRLHIFRSIHGVKRATMGEVYFALIVGLLAMVTQDGWIYMTALLHMSLADGLAAVIGTRYGKGNNYKILGSTKSLVGTLTFFVVSLAILAVYVSEPAHTVALLPLAGVALAATMLENVGIGGLDNISVPIVVAVALTHLTV